MKLQVPGDLYFFLWLVGWLKLKGERERERKKKRPSR